MTLIDEDRVLREHLASFGADALTELQSVLKAPQAYRDELLRQMVQVARPGDLARLIA